MDIEQARALCDKATPGPWIFDAPSGMEYGYEFYDAEGEAVVNARANTEFMAQARTLFPEALAAIERALALPMRPMDGVRQDYATSHEAGYNTALRVTRRALKGEA